MGEIASKVEACINFIKEHGNQTWDASSYDAFWELAGQCAEKDYAAFNAKLTPEITADRILGIRRPYLRKMASWIAKGDLCSYIRLAHQKNVPGVNSFEEMTVYGFAIGYVKAFDDAIKEIKSFLPLLDNWALNDTFCAALKITKKNLSEMKEFLDNCLKSKKPYDIRFAIVMLLTYYINDTYLMYVFECCDGCARGNYYIDMAVAWTISMCYIEYRQETLQYLSHCRLDRFTYNKSIQKMIESNQVSKEEKQSLKTLKRA